MRCAGDEEDANCPGNLPGAVARPVCLTTCGAEEEPVSTQRGEGSAYKAPRGLARPGLAANQSGAAGARAPRA